MAKKILVVLLIVTLTLGVLAGCNKREVDKKTHEEFLEVLPGAKNFSKVDISGKNIPSTIEEAYYDTNGAGFVIKVVTRGYQYGLTIIVGIDNNGVITGAKCTESNESWGYEENLGKQFIGRDKDTYVDVQAGVTSLTVNGYRNGIGDALQAYEVLKNSVHPDHNHGNSGGGFFDDIFGGNSENEPFKQVMPDATGFKNVEIAGKDLPSTIVEIKEETSGLGYVVKLSANGYNPGMIILIAVNTEGSITAATTLESCETWGLESKMNEEVVGKDASTIIDVQAGVTSLTVNGYRGAVRDALNALIMLDLTDGEIDDRTTEQILLDNLRIALPSAFTNNAVNYSDIFTEGYIVSPEGDIYNTSYFGADAIHKAKNGAGYVVEYNNEFVNVYNYYYSDASDEAIKIAENIQSLIFEVETVEVDISEYKNSSDRDIKRIFKYVTSVNKFETKGDVKSALMFEIQAYGYSKEPITVIVTIDMDGQIVDNLTISHSETNSLGGPHLEDGAYNEYFNGKNEQEAECVDTVSGATITTNAYKQAILCALNAYDVICGGSSSGNYTLGMGE